MSQSGETSASASPSIGANAPNEFVFVIHQESNVGRYYQFLFKRMYNCSELSDVTLRCDDRDIPAHRIVLAAHSPFFVKQFEEKPTNGLIIAIDNVKHNILMAAMELMYHGTVSIEPHSEPAFRELMENFEMSALMVNPNKFKANAVSQTVVKNVNREVKATETVNIEEKKRRVELHDIRELSEYDHFVSAIDGIIRTVTKDNIEAKAGDLLRHNIYTKERLVTVANLIMRQVISIGCETPTICYAKVSAAIKSRDRTTNGFSSILLGICQKFFTANIERKLEQPDCLDEPTLSSFDQQIHTLRMIEYHYLHERLRRIVRFLSELYTQNVINGGLLLDIQANQFANLDSGCHDYFFVLLAIFEAAGKMLSEEHPTYTNDCVAKLKQRLIAMGNKQILPDVKALITQAIEMSESGWEKKCELEPNTSNESLPNSDIEEHLFWIKNSVARQPPKLTYHLARNYAEPNKDLRRRGKQNVNKLQPVQKNTTKRSNTVKSNESGSNATKTPVIARTANQREKLLTVISMQVNNNQQPTQQNEAPRNDGVTAETNQKQTRTRRRNKKRQEKFIAEKIASKRK